MNDLVHYAAGLLVASAMGFKGWRRWALGLFAVAPDWDLFIQPALPWLGDMLDADRATRHAILLFFAHGSFSHSIFGLGLIVGLARLARLKGRALAAAALATLTHWPIDMVLTWSVWPFVPLSRLGIAWGLLTPEDSIVTGTAIVISLGIAALDVRNAWRKRRGARARGVPAQALGIGGLVLLSGVMALPLAFEAAIVAQNATNDTAVVDPVSYTRYVLYETLPMDRVRLVVADAWGRNLGEDTRPRTLDLTGGDPRAPTALETARDALIDAPPPSPITRPLLTARFDADTGALLVEARDASTVAAARHLGKTESGLDLLFDAEGRVATLYAVDDGTRLFQIPVDILPTQVPVAPP